MITLSPGSDLSDNELAWVSFVRMIRPDDPAPSLFGVQALRQALQRGQEPSMNVEDTHKSGISKVS